MCNKGKCVGKGVGSPCTDDGMCKSNICNKEGQKSVCILKPPGEHCYKGNECSSNTCYGNRCECAAPCVFGPKCRIGCPAHETCIYLPIPYANYCGDKKPLGGICEANAECTSGVCRNNKCSVKAPGEHCTRNSECGSSCWDETCECTVSHPLCTFSPTCSSGCRTNQKCFTSDTYPNQCRY